MRAERRNNAKVGVSCYGNVEFVYNDVDGMENRLPVSIFHVFNTAGGGRTRKFLSYAV